MKGFLIGIGVVVLLVVLVALGSVAGVIDWFVNDPKNGAVTVAKEQLNAREMLRKYEWFKITRASLDAKRADIKIYDAKISRLQKIDNLSRVQQEQLMIWEQEFAGVKLSYNELASEYNAQHAKINWAFADRGKLPEGATEPLPREYAPYVEQ